jgi:stress response protein SCP2
MPFYESMAPPNEADIIKSGKQADRNAFPFPGGAIWGDALAHALAYLPPVYHDDKFKAMVRIKTEGLPPLSSILFVFSAKNAIGEAVSVQQIRHIHVWLAIPKNYMDLSGIGAERLNEGDLSGHALQSVHSVPIEIVRDGNDWVLKSVSDGDKYRSILQKCGYKYPDGEKKVIQLIKGQKIKISPIAKEVKAELEVEAGFTPDISAFILDGQSHPKATGEELIFYNQPVGADGAIKYDSSKNSLSYDLSKIPEGIERIAVVVSVDEPNRHLGLAKKLSVKFTSDETSYIFEPDIKGTRCTAIEMCEVYRKEGIWRFNAKGAGVNGGLVELCSMYGVEVNG